MDAYDRANPGATDIPDIEKTQLKAAIEVFDRTFMSNMWKTIRSGFREKTERQAAVSVDF